MSRRGRRKREREIKERRKRGEENNFQLQLTTGKWAEAICNLLWCSFTSRRRLLHQWQQRLQWGGALLWSGRIFSEWAPLQILLERGEAGGQWRSGRRGGMGEGEWEGGQRAQGRLARREAEGEMRKKAIKQMQEGQRWGIERHNDNSRMMDNINVHKSDRS